MGFRLFAQVTFLILISSHSAFAGICDAKEELSPEPDTLMEKSYQGKFRSRVAGFAAKIKEFKEQRSSCSSKNYLAQNACLEACSKELQGGLRSASQATDALNMMSGAMNQTCTSFGEILKMMEMGFAAYNTACAGAKKLCTGACSGVADKGKEIAKYVADEGKKVCASLTGGDQQVCTAEMEKWPSEVEEAVNADKNSDLKYSGGKYTQCDKNFSAALTSAMSNAAGLLTTMMSAKQQCQKSSDVANAAIDCNVTANQQTQYCICLANPRQTGCQNGLTKAGEGGSLSTQGFSSNSNGATMATGSAENGASGLGSGGEPIQFPGLNGAGGGAPGNMANGGGPGGNHNGAGHENPGNMMKNQNANPANILAGDSGAAGAGGFTNGFRSTSGGDKMRQYLPGGKNDPARNVSGIFSLKEVTGPGGRSNWDKVRERYIDNRATFLDERTTP